MVAQMDSLRLQAMAYWGNELDFLVTGKGSVSGSACLSSQVLVCEQDPSTTTMQLLCLASAATCHPLAEVIRVQYIRPYGSLSIPMHLILELFP
ncbi:unnamed protein product [Gadus morhua 'NCC']